MIVDCFNHVPDRASFRFQLEVLGCSPGYIKLFGPRVARSFGLEVARPVEDEVLLLRELLALAPLVPQSRGHMLDAMNEAGVDVTVVHAEDFGPGASVQPLPRAYWEGVRSECGDRVRVLASVHPARGAKGVADLRSGIRDGLYVGVFLSPFQQQARISAGDHDDILRCCADEGVPAWIHCGMHWDQSKSLDEDRPSVFDNLCVAFPDLRVIAGHGGWPWLLEMCALAWKHPNLYIEVSAHRPLHMLRKGSGWDPLFNFGTSALRDKVVLGTASLLLGMAPKTVLDEYRALGIPEDTLAQWLGSNAVRLYPLEGRGHASAHNHNSVGSAADSPRRG